MPSKKKGAIQKDLGTFLRLYGKKAQKGKEPNDRLYDPVVEYQIRRMKPDELDTLLNGEEDERLRTRISR